MPNVALLSVEQLSTYKMAFKVVFPPRAHWRGENVKSNLWLIFFPVEQLLLSVVLSPFVCMHLHFHCGSVPAYLLIHSKTSFPGKVK